MSDEELPHIFVKPFYYSGVVALDPSSFESREVGREISEDALEPNVNP